jgi:hypothetical protein
VSLFDISTWYCSLRSTLLNVLRLTLSIRILGLVYLLTASPSLTFATTK